MCYVDGLLWRNQRNRPSAPTKRMAILELRAVRGWSLEQTARTFLVIAAVDGVIAGIAMDLVLSGVAVEVIVLVAVRVGQDHLGLASQVVESQKRGAGAGFPSRSASLSAHGGSLEGITILGAGRCNMNRMACRIASESPKW
jgi:hypothetical protein